MSRDGTLGLLRGTRTGAAFGASWVPHEAGDDARSVAGRAAALGVDFIFVDADLQWATDLCAALHEADVVAVWSVTGVVGRLAREWGWPEVIRATASAPAALAAPLAQALLATLDSVRTGSAAGVGAVVVADELSSSAGWLMAPDFALDALVPCYRSLAGEIARSGAAALFHSDGNVAALYHALSGAGFSAVHLGGIRAESLDRAAREVRASGMVPVGGIEVASLELESADDTAQRLVRLAGAGAIALCDDGGMTSAREFALVGAVLAETRVTLSAG